jgi:ABC-type polysaccharide/polyol phosphate transport system ATPase subunit
MKPIIRVDNISKRYHIGTGPGAVRYVTLRESIVKAARHPVDRLRRIARNQDEMIWALKGVSFEVMPGEVVGIIGGNGSGKSTLLKVLSRITKPSTGRVELYGRVASLLEVGTGFHPDLTGRENVYLNGAILGMKRREIDRRFDEIIAFADIDKFLDTPVKHYSSGMYVRLAFAVAAHLDPDILIVDEVLAVGDLNFQKKCLGKMNDVTRSGRTVLFVSHSLGMVEQLCRRVILLERGRIKSIGPTEEVIAHYKELCDLEASRQSSPHMIAAASQNGRPPGGADLLAVNPTSHTMPATGGRAKIRITAPASIKWEASTDSGFIKITSGKRGEGSGTIYFSTAANTISSRREGAILVGGQAVAVLQAACFSDVPEAHVNYEDICKLSAHAITSGVGEGNYLPDQPVTREQMALFIIRALGELTPPRPSVPSFVDVSPDRSSYAFIEEFARRGLVADIEDGRFLPGSLITREQAAVSIIKALGHKEPPAPQASRFRDVSPSSPVDAFIEELARRGIVTPDASGCFRPEDYVTRGEVAAMLVRAFNL